MSGSSGMPEATITDRASCAEYKDAGIVAVEQGANPT